MKVDAKGDELYNEYFDTLRQTYFLILNEK